MGRNPAGALDKAAGILDPFYVERDGPGILVLPQVLQGVDDIDIGFVADADGLAQADAPLAQIRQGLGDIGSALGGDPQLPGGTR